MRQTRRALKLFGQSLLGDEESAAIEYCQGCERDAVEEEEKEARTKITEEEESKARLLLESYITLEAHHERIKKATKTSFGVEMYAPKVAESIKRAEEEKYRSIAQSFRREHQKILVNAFEQSEGSARASIESEAMNKHTLFARKHKKIHDLLATEQQGFCVIGPGGFSDEDGQERPISPIKK